MLYNSRVKSVALVGAIGASLLAASPAALAQTFNVANLVSDGSIKAANTDPNLINPWGIAASPTGPLWVSDNNSGFTTVYNGAGSTLLTVSTPAAPGEGGVGATTGQVFNGSSSAFKVSSGGKTGSAVFLFATEDGTIEGWAPSVSFPSAVIAVNNYGGGAGAVYKGLAIGSTGGSEYLYAANFRSGEIEMYDSSFGLVKSFTDPHLASGYAPFNVQDLGGTLYVTYALQDASKHDNLDGAGDGYVDAFSLDGTFERRIVSKGGQVDAPWGLDIAPAGFRGLAGDLLVGNFGDGTISAFDPTTGAFEGQLKSANGATIIESGLWGLINGNGGSGGAAGSVYFTAGGADENHGLLGSISAVPEPGAWALMIIGLGLVGSRLRGRRRAVSDRTAAAGATA
jgi:uncharacterized protein (TIGR03118 family)